MSLEEAEAEMEKKHNSHFGGTGRLSQAIARNEGGCPTDVLSTLLLAQI